MVEEDTTAGRRTEVDTASASALGGGSTSLEVTFANSDQYIYSLV